MTLGIPGGTARIGKILALIESCRYSIHDLSRVELDETEPITPRFNMPFELGLAVGVERLRPGTHTWFVFETVARRADKSLSDLKGSDHYIHEGTVEGVMRELCNAFARRGQNPSVPKMLEAFRAVEEQLPALLAEAGTADCFTARVFEDLCFAAKFAVDNP